MPNLKPMVSRSGKMAQKAANNNKRRLTTLPTPKLVAIGTATCEKMVGIDVWCVVDEVPSVKHLCEVSMK